MRVARRDAVPLTDSSSLDLLLDRIGDARCVVLGEATCGTAEFCAWRTELTRRLIEEKGFSFVAADESAAGCRPLHTAVTGESGTADDPLTVLERYRRWPTWTWANTEVLEFTRWLRRRNLDRPMPDRAGIFGLDRYGRWDALHVALRHLDRRPARYAGLADDVRRALEQSGPLPGFRTRAAGLVPKAAREDLVALLVRLLRMRGTTPHEVSPADAEEHLRAILTAGPDAWNLRERQLADTLDGLLSSHGPRAKAVVWAHSSHAGDTRGTGTPASDLLSLGRLARERYGTDGAVLIGFGAYAGTVLAADRWEGRAQVLELPLPRAGTLEDRLHHALPMANALFLVPAEEYRPGWLREPADHRAIGVVYRPEWESDDSYLPTVLGQRYDAFLYLDRTSALTPLHGEHPIREPFPEAV